MIEMQMSAYTGNGMARMFHRTPPKAATVAAVMTRLMMDAARDGVENREGHKEANQGRRKSQKATGLENSLAHAAYVIPETANG